MYEDHKCRDRAVRHSRKTLCLGIDLLIEPNGELSDTVEGMTAILDALGHEETVGVNLDTGNSWLGGGDPLAFVKTFGDRIKHMHWKDLGAD